MRSLLVVALLLVACERPDADLELCTRFGAAYARCMAVNPLLEPDWDAPGHEARRAERERNTCIQVVKGPDTARRRVTRACATHATCEAFRACMDDDRP